MTTPSTSHSEIRPASLGAHVVPPERLDLVRPHVAMLAATAVKVGDALPLDADVSDMIQVLEAEAR